MNTVLNEPSDSIECGEFLDVVVVVVVVLLLLLLLLLLLILLLLWLHCPSRMSASLVALLHPSLSCATCLQLTMPIVLVSFSTSLTLGSLMV